MTQRSALTSLEMTRHALSVSRVAAIGAVLACASPRDARVVADTLGADPTNVRRIRVQARADLVENSGVTRSTAQSGILFTINDSGNEPLVFALDTTGADRGVWRVTRARNVDWEAVSVGPCGTAIPPADSAAPIAGPNECIYIGDVGDNGARRPDRTIYRVVEPTAQRAGFTGSLDAQSLVYRYSGAPHDVEAMYVAPNGSIFLITKRRLRTADGLRRPALVFEIPATAWESTVTPAIATLMDSLPIVPGSAERRMITDAALSPDGRLLAVRTTTQVFVFPTDSASGRVMHEVAPAVCNLAILGRAQGEGVAWLGRGERLLLSSEGRSSPMFAVDCPMPRATP